MLNWPGRDRPRLRLMSSDSPSCGCCDNNGKNIPDSTFRKRREGISPHLCRAITKQYTLKRSSQQKYNSVTSIRAVVYKSLHVSFRTLTMLQDSFAHMQMAALVCRCSFQLYKLAHMQMAAPVCSLEKGTTFVVKSNRF